MIKNPSEYLTSQEVSKIVGLTADHLRKLIAQGKLKAEKIGRNWFIRKSDAKKIKRQRYPTHMEITVNGNE